MKRIIALIIIGFLLAGCINPPPPVEPTADYGDNASVNYILWVDGSVIDTNMESAAREAGLYTPFRDYVPLKVNIMLGPENPYITGFVKAIVGMKVNETKMVDIPPGEAYGPYNSSLRYAVPVYYNMSAFEEIPRSYFEERNITVEEGAGFETDMGTVFIQNYTDTIVTIMYVFNQGDTFEYMGVPNVVVGSQNLTYLIMRDVKENSTYTTISPVTGNPTRLRITQVSNDTFVADENHQLAGKTLVYNLTLVSLEKPAG